MTYFARFEEVSGEVYRFDTRIYLAGGNPIEKSVCIGAVVGINPGSAQPRTLSKHSEIDLDGDKFLPYVRNRFLAAGRLIGVPFERNAYVQVLNLFYLRNQDLNKALHRLRELEEPPICLGEAQTFPLVWYAWGGETEILAPLKQRFLARRDNNAFYMNRDRSSFGEGTPGPMVFAKHPRGMPAAPIEAKLAFILGNGQ